MSKGSRKRRKARIAEEMQDPKWFAIRNLLTVYSLKIRRLVRRDRHGNDEKFYAVYVHDRYIGDVTSTAPIEEWVKLATKPSEYVELTGRRFQGTTYDSLAKHWRGQSFKGTIFDELSHYPTTLRDPGPDLRGTREAPGYYGAGQCKRPPAQDRMARTVRRK